MNLSTKKNMLFYDTLSGSLFRPREMSNDEDSVDMVGQTTQNVLLAGKEAQQALGISSAMDIGFKYGLAILILFTILTIIFLYLFYSHPPVQPGVVTTTIAFSKNSIANIGPNIVPINAT